MLGTRHPGIAVMVADAPRSEFSAMRGAAVEEVAVAATWVAPDGTQRTGTVPVAWGTTVGAQVPIWLDATGNRTPAPFQPVEAIAAGVQRGALTWFAIVAALSGACGLAHVALNRLRYAQWTREWERLGRDSSSYS
jgi:hypothetical protein